jgi:hypothetical protein
MLGVGEGDGEDPEPVNADGPADGLWVDDADGLAAST